jgi:predicted transcriptional regulator
LREKHSRARRGTDDSIVADAVAVALVARSEAIAGPGLVPVWYHTRMAMNLRLSDAEAAALRQKAAEEGRSMQEIARAAIADYVSNRPARLRSAIERVRTEDAELLDRLSR